MSEYIVKTDGEFGMYRNGLFVLEDEYMAVPAEPLIRCRDCVSYVPAWNGCTELCDSDDGYVNVEPDGFCAWGEKK